MPCIHYQDWSPRGDSLVVVETANEIIDEYQAEDIVLTLRQLYYQFVARGLIPNSDKSYKRLGDLVSKGRMSGRIDWEAIVDRTRKFETNPHWSGGADIIRTCSRQYAIDKWATQPVVPEVWIEKDALASVFDTVCTEHDVLWFCCRGYSSQSALWEAGQRIEKRAEAGQKTVILHFGDHDPSGVDMTRDIEERVAIFANLLDASDLEWWRIDGTPDFYEHFEVRRMALNMDQIRHYNPPPNPAKLTDARARAYIREHGHQSWELDALEPRVLRDLVDDAILEIRDERLWRKAVQRERSEQANLRMIADWYQTVVKLVREMMD